MRKLYFILTLTILALVTQSVKSQELIPYRNGEKWGYVNQESEMVISPRFERASRFSLNRAVIKTNGKYGYIDPEGNMVIHPIYDKAGGFFEGDSGIVAVVHQGDSKFNIDMNGNPKPFEYPSVICGGIEVVAIGSYSSFKENEFYGICKYIEPMRREKEVIVPATYPLLQWVSDDCYIAMNDDGKYGLINRSEQVLLDYQYDKLHALFGAKYVRSVIGDNWGLIYLNGNILLECKYQWISNASKGLIEVKTHSGTSQYIYRGKPMWED